MEEEELDQGSFNVRRNAGHWDWADLSQFADKKDEAAVGEGEGGECARAGNCS